MCGRFTLTKEDEEIERRFNAVMLEEDGYHPTYNAAPTQLLPVITNTEPGTIRFFRWGLIPFWAKDAAIGNRMINARGETISEKASFKNPIKKKRCLVLSDGFYEWKKTPKGKVPHRILLKEGQLMAYAGIWDTWKDSQGNIVSSFSIITTDPNELTQEVHDRMPVILPPEAEKEWLNEAADIKDILLLLRPYPAELMRMYPVSSLVNSPANNTPELVAPAASG